MVLLEPAEESERLRRPVLGQRDLGAKDLAALAARAVLGRREQPLDRLAGGGGLPEVELDSREKLERVFALFRRRPWGGGGAF